MARIFLFIYLFQKCSINIYPVPCLLIFLDCSQDNIVIFFLILTFILPMFAGDVATSLSQHTDILILMIADGITVISTCYL